MAFKRQNFGTKRKSELDSSEKVSLIEYKERFSKWQIKQIDLLTFCINLLTTLSIAVAGFIISNKDKAFFEDKFLCKEYTLSQISLLLLASCVTIGIIGVVSRLHDFRLTKNIVKARRRIYELQHDIKYEDCKPSGVESQKSNLDNLHFWTKILGYTTWTCLYLQIFFFLLAIWLIILNN